MRTALVEKRNLYAVRGNIATLTIIRFDGTEHVATFDTADLQQVRKRLWHYCYAENSQKSWPSSKGKTQQQSLANFIAQPPEDSRLLTVDGNLWNCTRRNLRIVKPSDLFPDLRHRVSKQPNIYPRPSGYEVQVHRHNKRSYLGVYPTLQEAVQVRDSFLRGFQ